MKSKSVFRLVRTGSRLLAIALVTLLAAHSSQAATLYWDGTGNLTSGWSDEANWDTAVDGTGGNPSLLIPLITDIASFSISTILSTAQNVNLNGN